MPRITAASPYDGTLVCQRLRSNIQRLQQPSVDLAGQRQPFGLSIGPNRPDRVGTHCPIDRTTIVAASLQFGLNGRGQIAVVLIVVGGTGVIIVPVVVRIIIGIAVKRVSEAEEETIAKEAMVVMKEVAVVMRREMMKT
jgi:hypothetical protein